MTKIEAVNFSVGKSILRMAPEMANVFDRLQILTLPEGRHIESKELARDFISLAKAAQESEEILTAVNRSLDGCVQMVTNQPSTPYQIGEYLYPIRSVVDNLILFYSEKRIPAVTRFYDTLKALSDSRFYHDKNTEVAVELGHKYLQIMGALGFQAPLLTKKSLTAAELETARRNNKEPDSLTYRRTSKADSIHVSDRVPKGIMTVLVDAPLLAVPEEQLTAESNQIHFEIPFVEDQQLNYDISFVVQATDGTWHPVELEQPVAPKKYDANIHTPSQLKGYWPKDLPNEKARFALVIKAKNWLYQKESDKRSEKTAALFLDTKAEAEVADLMVSFADIGRPIDADEYDRTDNRVIIGKTAAQALLNSNDDAVKRLLGTEIALDDTWNTTEESLYVTYSARFGTTDLSGRAVPSAIRINSYPGMGSNTVHQASEIMYSPDSLKEIQEEVAKGGAKGTLAQDQLEILESAGLVEESDSSDTEGYAVFSHLHRYVPRTDTAKRDDTIHDTEVSALYLEPTTDDDPTEQEEWNGNEMTLMPFIAHTSRTIEHTYHRKQTLYDVLKHIVDTSETRKTLTFRSNALLEKYKLLKAQHDATHSALQNFITQVGDTYGGGERFSLSGGTYSGSRRYTPLKITLGQKQNAGESEINTVRIIGMLTPVKINLVART